MTRIAVTGPDGFVGRHLCRLVLERGHDLRPLVRDAACADVFRGDHPDGPDPAIVGDLGPDTDWAAGLAGVETVIHLAARVHVMDETEADPLAAFRLVNTAGTERLARSAVEAGARRLVYVSSLKVSGECTTGRRPYTPDEPPGPEDPYAVSKHEAEIALARISRETGLETVILRPPLVHGPGVKGNLARMMGLIAAGRPLPLAGLNNRRSLVGVENLADALLTCAEHPAAAGRTYLIADGIDPTVEELARALGRGLRRPARLFRLPGAAGLLRALGKGAVAQRLYGELRADASALREELSWTPPVEFEAGVGRMCAGPGVRHGSP